MVVPSMNQEVILFVELREPDVIIRHSYPLRIMITRVPPKSMCYYSFRNGHTYYISAVRMLLRVYGNNIVYRCIGCYNYIICLYFMAVCYQLFPAYFFDMRFSEYPTAVFYYCIC